MRSFPLLATAGALAALVATAPAAAKGPSTASLTGPGLDHAVPVKGEGESGPGTPLGGLVQLGGACPRALQPLPAPSRPRPPFGDLRPRSQVAARAPAAEPHGTTPGRGVWPHAEAPGPV